MECVNASLVTNDTMEADEPCMAVLSKFIKKIALPSVCVFGIVGNILNLTILTRRKLQKSFRTLEQAANLCLIALALSDLMFCLLAFPTVFLPSDDRYSRDTGPLMVYRLFGTAVINVFIMESTLLTVAMSLERFMAICFPLRQDLYLTTRRIKYVIFLTVIFSVSFNIPVLWRYRVEPHCAYSNASTSVTTTTATTSANATAAASYPGEGLLHLQYYTVTQVKIGGTYALDNAYRWAWAIAGNFVPLFLLFYFNVCLWRNIYRSYKLRRQFHRPNQSTRSSHILTLTLIAIVFMFFILVAPSETVLHVKDTLTIDKVTSMAIEDVLNLMQALNFSLNFILYCIISPYFRKTLKYIMLCGVYNMYQVSKEWKKDFETSLM